MIRLIKLLLAGLALSRSGNIVAQDPGNSEALENNDLTTYSNYTAATPRQNETGAGGYFSNSLYERAKESLPTSPEAAVRYFKQYLELFPAKVSNDNVDDSIRTLTEIALHLDNDPKVRNKAHYLLGKTYYKFENLEKAQEHFQAVLDIPASKSQKIKNLSTIYLKRILVGITLANIADFSPAEELNLTLSDYKKVYEIADQLKNTASFATTDTVPIEYLFYRGKARFLWADFAGSIDDLYKYIASNNNHKEALFLRGAANYALGNIEAAMADLQKSNGIDHKEKSFFTFSENLHPKFMFTIAFMMLLRRTMHAYFKQLLADIIQEELNGIIKNHTSFTLSSETLKNLEEINTKELIEISEREPKCRKKAIVNLFVSINKDDERNLLIRNINECLLKTDAFVETFMNDPKEREKILGKALIDHFHQMVPAAALLRDNPMSQGTDEAYAHFMLKFVGPLTESKKSALTKEVARCLIAIISINVDRSTKQRPQSHNNSGQDANHYRSAVSALNLDRDTVFSIN